VGEVVVLNKAKPNKQWWRGHVDGAPEREGVFPRDTVEEPPPYEGRAPLAEVRANAGPPPWTILVRSCMDCTV
jgi:hypothetical protein